LSTCKLSFSSSSRNFCHVNLVDFFQDWSQNLLCIPFAIMYTHTLHKHLLECIFCKKIKW
jgi:hypothetical protein